MQKVGGVEEGSDALIERPLGQLGRGGPGEVSGGRRQRFRPRGEIMGPRPRTVE